MWFLSVFIVLMIGLSRLYLGVHFPTDVLAGWLLGLAVAFLFIRGEAPALARLKKYSPAQQIAAGFGFSVIMVLVGLLVGALTANSPDPAAWDQFSTHARSLTQYFTLAGALFGSVTGFVLMWNRARFETKGTGWQQAGRYCVGIAGVLAIYLVLDVLFSLVAGDETMAGYLLRYIRYMAITLWATYGAPLVFIKVRLADPVVRVVEILPVDV